MAVVLLVIYTEIQMTLLIPEEMLCYSAQD